MTERFFGEVQNYGAYSAPARNALSEVMGTALKFKDAAKATEAVVAMIPQTDSGVLASIVASGVEFHTPLAVTDDQKLFFTMGAAAHSLALQQHAEATPILPPAEG